MGLQKVRPLEVQINTPTFFLCPISLELMKDPVTLSSGQTFDRSSIQTWLDDGNATCPVTRMLIDAEQEELIPNHALRRMIQAWCVQNKSSGIERILTPRQPPSLKDIPHLLDQLRLIQSSSTGNQSYCHLDALEKLCLVASDRPKARRLLLSANAPPLLSLVLSKSLPLHCESTPSREVQDLLWLLANLADESPCFYWEPTCTEEVIALAGIIADAQCKAEVRRNAAIVLSRAGAESLECAKREIKAMKGFMAGVLWLIKEDSAASTASLQSSVFSDYFCKPGLSLLLAICSSSLKYRQLAIDGGALNTLANLLSNLCPDTNSTSCPDKTNRRTIQLGLKVWECVCESADARATTSAFVGLLVRLMCTVSDKADKHLVRILWLLLKFAPDRTDVARNGVEQGAFLKVMAIAQSHGSLKTRTAAGKIGRTLSAFIIPDQSYFTLR